MLEALIGSAEGLYAVVGQWPAAVLVPLVRDLALVPMTDELLEAVADGTTERTLGFTKLPVSLDGLLAAGSEAGPVGYVEAEFFGGVGNQRAALWVDGRLALGPLSVDDDEPFAYEGSPVSQLLACLGVDRGSYRDEFEAVGLGRHRDTADWLA